jgi:hypothetical protein
MVSDPTLMRHGEGADFGLLGVLRYVNWENGLNIRKTLQVRKNGADATSA